MPSPQGEFDPLQLQLPRMVVPRPAIESRLDEVTAGGVGLVVASAGSGKSVLVRQWASARPTLRVVGFALSPRHDDPVVLARDLVEALRSVAPTVDPAISELVTRGGSALGDAFVDGWVDAFAAAPLDVVLLLEDVHALSSRPALDDLGRLLTARPDDTRAVVTTRRDPPWPLHRLRLLDKVVELRGADLAFREVEAQRLVENVSQRRLPHELVTTLVDRTEGWAVGLQLAAISLRTAPDVEAFVESFAGSDHLVAEYLLNEVIERQEPEVRRFLLHTSVLDRFSADLCEAVAGTGNAHAMIEELCRRSMFMIPLDASGATFRYHHLFAEVLRYRLRLEHPDVVNDLHHKAARWLLAHRREEEAVAHLIASGDSREVLRVIVRVGHRLFERGEPTTLVRWLRTLAEDPDAPVAVEVNLLAAQLAADDAAAATETYRRIVRRADLTLGERTAANALHSLQAFRGLPPQAVIQLTDQVRDALPHLGSEDVADFLGVGGIDSVQAMAEFTGGLAHFFSGDLTRAAAALERVRTLPGMRYGVWQVYVLSSLALVRAWQGRCTQALGLARAAIDQAEAVGVAEHHASAHAHLAMALVHLDRVEPEAAEQCLTEARSRMRGREASVAHFDLHAALVARLAAVREGLAPALALLSLPSASGTEAHVLREARGALRTRLLIGAGDLVGARASLNGSRRSEVYAAARVELALAAADVASARVELDAWRPSSDDVRSLVRRHLRQFMVARAEGDLRGAGVALTEAVATAAGEELRWPFVEVPSALRAVRRDETRETWLTGDFLWETALRLEPGLAGQEALVEPLTERELAVLAYLPGRLRNQDIAAELFLSVNTIKTHVGSIYRKLEVSHRDDAVDRATRLGLL